MKKLYTLLLAASVAASASADALKAPVAEAANTPAIRTDLLFNRARSAKAELNKFTGRTIEAAAPAKEAPAKAAPATMAEIAGVYEYSLYLYSSTDGGTKGGVMTIAAGDAENQVKLIGLRFPDVTIIGTVDFAAGTITCAPQELLEMPADDPAVSEDVWLWGYNTTTNQQDRNKSVVININADGTLSSNDVFVYGVEGMPGYSYALFDDLTMTKSTTYNTKVTFKERDLDDEGYFLDTYTEYETFASTELNENTVVGNENLGECVVLSHFLFETNSAITATYPLYIQIERDTHTIFLDRFYWFDATITDNAGNPVDFRAAISQFIPSGTQIKFDAIEGTFAANTIEWTCEWGAYASSVGFIGYYQGCKLELPFYLEQSGVNDVTVDNNENAPVEYFNLQGMRVSEPAAGQVVIRRQGTKVEKLFVK